MCKLRTLFIAAVFSLTGQVGAALAETSADCPALDDKQLGQLLNIVELARQPDWAGMEPGPRGAFDAYQFQLAWMYYATAVAQTQLTPAYRELYHETSARLLEKMLQPDVWKNWLKVIKRPQFAKYLPAGVDSRDPVRDMNIMYSGHLLQMIGLLERLYGDERYDAPESIVFEIPGPNGFRNTYDHSSLAKLIQRQFIENDLKGIECEPNLIFAECNQHPILGLIDYDKVHGTNLADLREAFWKTAAHLGYLDAKTERFAGPYLVHEQITGHLTTPWNDGWSGVTLHAWKRSTVEEIYPKQRDAELARLIDKGREIWSARWAERGVSTDFGFLAAYAAELDDQDTRNTLLAYADANFNPRWKGNRYFYPRHDVDVSAPAAQVTGAERLLDNPSGEGPQSVQRLSSDQYGQHLVGPLTGNALLAFARLNPGDGLWKTYNALPDTYDEGDLELVDVNYPQALVPQAFYDKSAHRLVVALKPGSDDRGPTKFAIRNLDKRSTYTVSIDGVDKAVVHGEKIAPQEDDLAIGWGAGGELTIEYPLGEGLEVVVERNKGL